MQLLLGALGLAGAVSPTTGSFVEAPKVVWHQGKKAPWRLLYVSLLSPIAFSLQ